MTSATASPTYRTRPLASSGSVIGWSPGEGRSSVSAAVSTAITPGASRAASASIPVIRACAIGLRTNVARAAPASSGTRRSSV